MKIRAITIGQRIPYLADNSYLSQYMEERLAFASILNNELIERYSQANIEVQTKRLCSQPILSYEKQLYEKK